MLGVGVASLALIAIALPPTPAQRSGEMRINWAALRTPSALGVLLFIGLVMLAYEVFLVAQASWLKADFSADERGLGQLYGIVGIAELIGSLAVVGLADRFGKRRSVIAGFVLTAMLMLALPLTSGRWDLLTPTFFAFYVCIEFAIVAAIPFMSGVAPTARATLLALSVAVVGIVRAIGAQISAPLYISTGMLANAALGAVLIVLGVLLVARVREAETG
jgi:predicted MFS family arabinose efflux permease